MYHEAAWLLIDESRNVAFMSLMLERPDFPNRSKYEDPFEREVAVGLLMNLLAIRTAGPAPVVISSARSYVVLDICLVEFAAATA